MATERTYHKDVGLPADYQRPMVGLPLTYSFHAINRAYEKDINLPKYMPVVEVIEVTLMANKAVKWVVRSVWTIKADLVMVVMPDGFVKTVWTNSKTDRHSTLDRSKYANV